MFLIDILKDVAGLFLEMAPYIILGLVFVALLKLFFTKDFVARQIGKNNFASVFKAAIFGVPLPLCSCGVIPTAVYLAKSGASKGSVISFLISTPQTGIDSMIATYGMLGWIFAIFRPVAALIMGITGGSFIRFIDRKPKTFNFDKFDSSKDKCDDPDCSDDSCTDDNCGCGDSCESDSEKKKGLVQRVIDAGKYSFVEFLDDIAVQFLVGIIIAGLISYFIPEGFFSGSIVNNGILGMLLMIAIGIPMYVCATASIPIAITLMMKGFSPGVAFVFLVTGPATNAASLAVLSNVLGKKITTYYVAVISISAIAFGYLLDFIFDITGSNPMMMMMHEHNHDGGMLNYEFQLVIGIIFLILLSMSIYRKKLSRYFNKSKVKEKVITMQKIEIEGMSCNHCVMNVEKAIKSTKGVEKVEVNLSENAAYIDGAYNLNDIREAIEAVGYKVVG